MLAVRPNSTYQFAKKEAGGKGFNLYLMTGHGLNVPTWMVLGKSIMNSFFERHDLRERFKRLLTNEHTSWKQVSHDFTELIMKCDFSSEEVKFFQEVYSQFKGKMIAVRSSAIDEDSGGHSFAGQLSSYLYIKTEEQYLEAIKKCWASGYSERGLVYREENKLQIHEIEVAVVVQEMIDPEKSGVLFTGNPIDGSADQLVINSVYGVGEGLVGGLLDADTFVVDKNTLDITEENLVEKTHYYTNNQDGDGITKLDFQGDKDASSLSSDELKELANLGIRTEEFYQFPQDMEWAIKEGQVYLLQSRPITTNIRIRNGHLYVWDNSNIVESYGGITKPLTFGFARYVYHQVYVQFCEILMVPNSNIREMQPYLKNMLGLFYGRVYYNLLNWYKLTSILPGYKFNRQFMETMMGTNESLGEEIADRVRPPAFQDGFLANIRKILTGFKFLYFHFAIQGIVDNFLARFHRIYDGFRKIPYHHMASDQIYRQYLRLEKEMLWQWHAPIINDFLCMVHFGIFKKLTEKWLGHLGDAFHNDLLAGNGNLESAEPTKQLIVLSGIVEKNQALKALLFTTKPEDMLEALKHSEFQDFYNKVDVYLDKFGFRCMSEMKLEIKDMHHDSSQFFVFLRNIVNSGQTDLHEFEKREKQIREDAESKLNSNIHGLKKMVYSWSLHHARKAVMNRENTRFCRTRVYGVVRAMFFAMGSDFVRKGVLDHEEDIFFISLEELQGALDGHNSIMNLRKVAELRKAEYQGYEEGEEPLPRFFTRGIPYYQNQHFADKAKIDLSDLKENQLKGLGACPGVLEGTVKVIMGPEDDLTLNGEILVTKRTDPGWIPLYPSLSGLLVERGGLLSHSAIVAREMGLPTIVSIQGLCEKLKTGDKIRMDGETGLIEIIEE